MGHFCWTVLCFYSTHSTLAPGGALNTRETRVVNTYRQKQCLTGKHRKHSIELLGVIGRRPWTWVPGEVPGSLWTTLLPPGSVNTSCLLKVIARAMEIVYYRRHQSEVETQQRQRTRPRVHTSSRRHVDARCNTHREQQCFGEKGCQFFGWMVSSQGDTVRLDGRGGAGTRQEMRFVLLLVAIFHFLAIAIAIKIAIAI